MVQLLFWFGILCCLAASGLELALPGYSQRLASWPFVVGLVTIGMLHGSYDVWKLRSSNESGGSTDLLLLYLGCMAASVLLLYLQSGLAIHLFLVLSALHFGHEDVTFHLRSTRAGRAEAGNVIGTKRPADTTVDSGLRTASGLRWTSAGRGALVIGLPLLLHPVESGDFFRRVQTMLGRNPTVFAWEYPSGWYAIAFSLACLLIIAAVISASLHTFAIRSLLETAAIACAAYALNPEFWIGLYLLVWHAPRHLSQIALTEVRPNLFQLSLQSLAFLLPAWFAVGIVWIGNLRAGESLEIASIVSSQSAGFLSAATVACYAVVTLPHHLLEQGMLALPIARTDARSRGRPYR